MTRGEIDMPRARAVFFPFDQKGNPYQRLLAKALREHGFEVEDWRPGAMFLPRLLRGGRRVLHVHWPHGYCLGASVAKSVLKSTGFMVQLAIARVFGYRVVWTVHNLHDHERRMTRIDRAVHWLLARLSNSIIVHCPRARQLLGESYGERAARRSSVIPHGPFSTEYPSGISREAARAELEIGADELVYLFLGAIRPYKGLGELLPAFAGLGLSRTRLVIAGRPHDQDDDRRLREQIGNDPSVLFHSAFVPDDRVQVYMAAADVVVFPYRDVLTSGAVLLAMGFGKTCVAPRLGCLPEYLDDQGAFLYEHATPEGLPGALRAASEQRDRLPKMGEHNRGRALTIDWLKIASHTARLYRGESPGDMPMP